MKVSKNCLELIAKFESFSSKPYICPAGVPTIGFGATYYQNGKKVTMKDKAITKDNAYKLLEYQTNKYADAINRYVQVPLTQNQFDALVSFVFNVGANAFRTSTLLKYINLKKNKKLINEQFMRWTKGGGKVLKGLILRRKEEVNLYNRS